LWKRARPQLSTPFLKYARVFREDRSLTVAALIGAGPKGHPVGEHRFGGQQRQSKLEECAGAGIMPSVGSVKKRHSGGASASGSPVFRAPPGGDRHPRKLPGIPPRRREACAALRLPRRSQRFCGATRGRPGPTACCASPSLTPPADAGRSTESGKPAPTPTPAPLRPVSSRCAAGSPARPRRVECPATPGRNIESRGPAE
jgi:hypothetical protein